jgi:type II secretory pathway pseudopilin PulG
MLILGILMTLVIGASRLLFAGVHVDETKANMKVIMSAITEYYEAKHKYPPNQASLVSELTSVVKSRALIGKLGENVWNPTDTSEFRDAWGGAIRYSPSGGLAGAPELTSAGPDGDFDTDDDVRFNK